MSEPIENLYFNWLCAQVIENRNKRTTPTYSTLLRTLHNTEFVWMLSGDDNRAADGKELRSYFLMEAEIPDDPEWRHWNPCSFLEMFIAFSRRTEFATNVPAIEWFWEFMENLRLNECNDASGFTPEEIQEVLDHFAWRTYDVSGNGGLFPIEHPTRDQRDVELWYQFCDYLTDQGRMP